MHGQRNLKLATWYVNKKAAWGEKNESATCLQTFYCGVVRGPHVVKTTVSCKYNYLRLQKNRAGRGFEAYNVRRGSTPTVRTSVTYSLTIRTHEMPTLHCITAALVKADSHHRDTFQPNLALCFSSSVHTELHGQGTVRSRTSGSCYNSSLVTQGH